MPFSILSSLYSQAQAPLVETIKVDDNCFEMFVSSRLLDGDSQYVHEILDSGSGEKLGDVRSLWGFKYGSRYGGVGIEADGRLAYLEKTSDGKTKLRIAGPPVASVSVSNKIKKIPD